MTNSYKDLLNLDIDNIEPLELSSTKKAAIKRTVLKSTSNKKAFKWGALLTSAAIIGISTITALSFTFPTVASQIPFMQNIVSYFEEDMNIDFERFSTHIGQVQSDNGISVMIENAVYDGTAITISYAIETTIDLGDRPLPENSFDIAKSNGWSMNGRPFRKVSDNKYIGVATITPRFTNEITPNEVSVSWKPYSFTNTVTNAEYKGDWQFEFELTKLESNFQLVNESTNHAGVTVLIKSLQTNDMSTVIHFDQFIDQDILNRWHDATAQFNLIKDDLGNIYPFHGNNITTTDNGLSYTSSGSIRSLDPNAKSLTFVPTIYFSLGSGKGVETEEMDPIVISIK